MDGPSEILVYENNLNKSSVLPLLVVGELTVRGHDYVTFLKPLHMSNRKSPDLSHLDSLEPSQIDEAQYPVILEALRP